jgi:serine/threonine protein kinase
MYIRFQHQLNGYPGGANVLFLRRYKAYFNQIAKTTRAGSTFFPGTLRAYLDYAPHGDLYGLMNKYRAFDKHLPEAFVWHVFHSLAQAVLAMNDGPWTRLARDSNGKLREIKLRNEVFLNHFDMKPSNIFLSFSAAEQSPTTNTGSGEWKPEYEYPQVLLADFGVSDILTQDNKNKDHKADSSYKNALLHPKFPGKPNPSDYWDKGQDVYGSTLNPGQQWNSGKWGIGSCTFQPPEQLRLGAHWLNPPNGLPVTPAETADLDTDGRPTYDAAQEIVYDDSAARNYRFMPASNIWAVGKIMHDLAYHTHSSYYLDEFGKLPMNATDQEQRYDDAGGNMLDQIITKPEYSDELQALITTCMDIDQGMRPSAKELVRSTKHQLDVWIKAAQTMSVQERKELRLFYRGNEINQMSPGPNNFDKSDEIFDYIMKDKYQDPALEQLNLPEKGWHGQKRKFEAEQAEGLWRMPQFEMDANGVTYFEPPQVGKQPNPTQIYNSSVNATLGNQAARKRVGNILDISDPKVSAYLTKLENGVEDDLFKIKAVGQKMQKSLISMRLKEDTLVENKDIIATLTLWYSLPPQPEENWISATVSVLDGDSILTSHDPLVPQDLRAVDRQLNTLVRNSMESTLTAQQLTRARLLECLAEYTRRCVKDVEKHIGGASERVLWTNILNELILRYTHTLGHDHKAVCSEQQLKTFVGRIPTGLPFGAPPVGAPPVVAPPVVAPPVIAPPVVAPPVIAPPVVAPPANPQPGDARAPASDGTPRYYCKHVCRTGTKPNGDQCGHNCCQNGAKNPPK